ncbi:MAG TPA: acyl-CoA synthetase [Vicinamibacterales bacterium]|nr:acyl-CoA synthetase [Vicinamibacterales bacterium]
MAFTEPADGHGERPAVVDGRGVNTHADLAAAAARVASSLAGPGGDARGARVALLIPPGFEFAAVLRGVWQAGGVAVPLAVTDPAAELDYVLRDSGAETLVTGQGFAHAIAPLAAAADVRLCTADSLLETAPAHLPPVAPGRRALIVYSSGTTAKPKGVVLTHANVAAHVASLTSAWAWTAADRTLLVLPLHHVHGLINVLCCAIGAGACCEMPPRFDAAATWARLASGEITVFTAVPTIYHRLIAAWDAAPEGLRRVWSAGAGRARVMMSGSAALPTAMLGRWQEITGHVLLERYGLTEAGMVLSNPLEGERRPGHVGLPLPGVEVRLVDEQGSTAPRGDAGELEARGPGVFLEYWRQPDLTRAAFHDDWFRTGDVAVLEDGSYRLLGRLSVDIIKSGGYKISALEIEDALRAHPAVVDCAVVGAPDPQWGERVCAAVELGPGAALSLEQAQAWLCERLSSHKIPKELSCVPALPRNALGKVIKPQVAAWFS